MFSQILRSSTTAFKLLSDYAGVPDVINNTPIDPEDIILLKLHLTWKLIGADTADAIVDVLSTLYSPLSTHPAVEG